MDYYRLCQGLVKPDVHFGIYIRENHAIYNDEFLRQAFATLDEARQLADSETISQRVERVRMQPLFLHSMRHKEQARQDGTWNELVALLRKYNTRPRENQTLEDFIK